MLNMAVENYKMDNSSQNSDKIGKRFLLCLLTMSGILRFYEKLSSRNLRVLTYHRIVSRDQLKNNLRPRNCLFSDEFERQMAFVRRRYNPLSGDEIREILSGSKKIPRYSMAITFDDGYENNFTEAFPILQRYGLKAIFFITTGMIGEKKKRLWFDRFDTLLERIPRLDMLRFLHNVDPSLTGFSHDQFRSYLKTLSHTRQTEILDRFEENFGKNIDSLYDGMGFSMMNWDQVRSMASAGMTIGSHTVNHLILSKVLQAEAHAEILLSRQRIKEETGLECWCFSYPNGERWDFRSTDEISIQSAGYLCAFTQIPGSIKPRSPRFALPRIPIPDTGDLRIFRSHVSGIQRIVKSFSNRKCGRKNNEMI